MSGLPMRFLAVLITAALLYAMQRTTPGYTEITGPIPRQGEFGEVAKARSFGIRVEKIILADKLHWQAFGRSNERDSDGRWAVVVAAAEAAPETATLTGAVWQSASGLRFDTSQRVSQFRGLLGGNRLEPGLPRRGLLIFEIGREDSRDATLLVSEGRWPRLDTQLRIALPQNGIEQAGTLDLDALLP